MSDNKIFNKLTCKKGEVFSSIISLMITGGWSNISTDPINDFIVMKSTGISGNNPMFIQLRNYITNPSTQNVETTNYNMAGYRLLKNYEPGTPSVITRSADRWCGFPITQSTLSQNTDFMEITYYVDRDKCIFIIRTSFTYRDSYDPIIIYFGVPENKIGYGMGDRDLIFATNFCCYSNGGAYTSLSRAVVSVDTPLGQISTDNAATICPSYLAYSQVPSKYPDWRFRTNLSHIYYGDTALGYIGKFTDVYAIYVSNPISLIDGDILTIDSEKYEVAYTRSMSSSYNTFTTPLLAYRVA